MRSYLLYPSLTTLDLSYNQLRTLPPTISLLNYLAVLNLASNAHLESLPPELGLLDKLWSIDIRGCPLKEPTLKSIIEESGKYRTAEVLACLRQRLENARSYTKMKLMLLGGAEVGKSSLLSQMRLEGQAVSRKSGVWNVFRILSEN